MLVLKKPFTGAVLYDPSSTDRVLTSQAQRSPIYVNNGSGIVLRQVNYNPFFSATI